MNPTLEIVLLIVGVLLGYHFYIIDCLLYAFYLHPDDETSRHLREQIKQRRYWLALRMMITMTMSPKRYIHKSAKFLAAFIVMAVFVVTSTTSALSRGFVVGFAAYLILELFKVNKDPAMLRAKFFWDLSSEVKDASIKSLSHVVLVFMILVCAFALI